MGQYKRDARGRFAPTAHGAPLGRLVPPAPIGGRDMARTEWPEDGAYCRQRSSIERVVGRYAARRPERIQSRAWLEGATFTVPEVRTLLSGGTADGSRIEDVRTVQGLAAATDLVVRRAKDGPVTLDDPALADEANRLLTEHVLLTPGVPRRRDGLARADSDGRIVVRLLDGTEFHACRGTDLEAQTALMHARLAQYEDEPIRAMAYVAAVTYLQPFPDGNKRTARLVGDLDASRKPLH